MTSIESSRPAERQLPNPTASSRTFWTGGASGELRIHHCDDCDRFFHPPAPACFRCAGMRVAPKAVSGEATVAAFSIDRHQWFMGFPPPYVVAIVELREDPGVRLTTNIVGCDVEAVHVGMEVAVLFEEWDDVWIPVFAPVAS